MKRRRRVAIPYLFLSVLLGAALLWAATRYTRELEERALLHRREVLAQAVERGIVNCYALEGSYPPDIAYLEEHYGLTYDKTQFYVDYRPIGSNLRPDFAVLPFSPEAEDADG